MLEFICTGNWFIVVETFCEVFKIFVYSPVVNLDGGTDSMNVQHSRALHPSQSSPLYGLPARTLRQLKVAATSRNFAQ